jgi:hypothetical protein
MAFVIELLFQVVVEFVAYGIGRAVLLVVAPFSGVESVTKSPKRPWAWRGFSFRRDGKRYFYIESVQLIGLGVMFALVAIVVLANTYLK